MRPGLKTALTFTAGLVVGAASWGGYQMYRLEWFMRLIESSTLNEQAVNLQFLSSAKRTGFWRESLFEGLPNVAQTANRYRENPEYANVLWNVRLAYALNDRPVPQEIDAILSNLPAESAPSCPMPRRKLGLPPLPTQEAPRTSHLNDPQL